MKARKRVIGIFLAVVVMCLGIGFAALADELLIDGTVAINTNDVSDTFDKAIYFENASIDLANPSGKNPTDDSVANPSAVIDSTTKDTLSITTAAGAFSAIGQKVEATVDIVNASATNDAIVALTAAKVGTNSTDATDVETLSNTLTVGSFTVTLEWPASATAEGAGYKLPKNNGTDNGKITGVKITIALTKLPTADETGYFQFKLTATAV